MDLNQFAKQAEEGAVLTLKDPAGEPLLHDGKPVTITLAGQESERFKKARNSVGDRLLKTAAPRTGPMLKTTAEGVNDEAFMLASVTIAWDGVFFDGALQECTFANAKRLYAGNDFVRDQVNAFVGDRKNFWNASSQT